MEPPEDVEVYGDDAIAGVVNYRMHAPPPPASPVAIMVAQQEELGDLKLYRIPEPVTVAARSQKQVALLHRAGVQVRTVYRMRFFAGASRP